MVSTTAGGRPLKSVASRPGATHGGSIDLDAVPYGAEPLREEVLPQRNAPGRCCREGNEFGKPGLPAGPDPRPP